MLWAYGSIYPYVFVFCAYELLYPYVFVLWAYRSVYVFPVPKPILPPVSVPSWLFLLPTFQMFEKKGLFSGCWLMVTAMNGGLVIGNVPYLSGLTSFIRRLVCGSGVDSLVLNLPM